MQTWMQQMRQNQSVLQPGLMASAMAGSAAPTFFQSPISNPATLSWQTQPGYNNQAPASSYIPGYAGQP